MNTYARRTRQHRLTYVGIWAVGTVAFIGLLLASFPAIAGVVFLLAGAVATGYERRAAEMFDERDDDILRTASANTMHTVGIASGLFFPTMSILAGTGVVEWPIWLSPVALFVAALYALWGGQVLFARARR